MPKVLKIFITLMMLLGLIRTAHASTSILYFGDYAIGTDRMAEALGSLGAGYSVTTVGSSSAFATQIGLGTYNLGIFMVQDSYPIDYNDGITALGTFVAGGGRSIYTDWYMDNTYAALFGATWTGNTNESSFNVTLGPLAAGISNPVSLTTPGWGTYSMGVTGPVVAATFPSIGGAIAIGNSGRSITNGFLTDTFADGATGVQLYTNEIKYLTDPVPLPGAVWLLGSGLLGLGVFRGRMRKK